MSDLVKTWEAVNKAIDWMDEANCKNMDTNLFFPNLGQNYDPFIEEVCMECSVIEECAWYANETSADFGMFGGMSPNDRHKWRKKNDITLGQTRAEWEAA